MIRFIFPIDGDVERKRSAWRRFDEFCAVYDVEPVRPRMREETFEHACIFSYDDGTPMTDRRRAYTATFFLEDEDAEHLWGRLCDQFRKLARRLTANTILLCVDDRLGVHPSRPM